MSANVYTLKLDNERDKDGRYFGIVNVTDAEGGYITTEGFGSNDRDEVKRKASEWVEWHRSRDNSKETIEL